MESKIATLLLGVLLHLPSSVFSAPLPDSLIIDKIFSYKRNFAKKDIKDSCNAYVKYNFNIIKRNPTLLFVPTMYYIAKGQRSYVGEIYGKATFANVEKFDMKRQVFLSTVPHKHNTMTTMVQYLTPNMYGVAMFRNKILSPFNRNNRRFYKYRVTNKGEKHSRITFIPRLQNTQLIRGHAIVDNYTGRILRSRFDGEQDMMRFYVNVYMGDDTRGNSLLPQKCDASAVFKFAGNEIDTRFYADYNCQTTLPDSINNSSDTRLMEELRPMPLSTIEKKVYESFYDKKSEKADTSKTEAKRENKFMKMAWDTMGDHLLNSLKAETDNAYIKLSPIINPQYLSYSHSRGLAYKMKLRTQHNFTKTQNLSFNPNFGYNFKIKKFYFTSPLRFTYDKNHDGWIELLWANGNRITNSSVLDVIRNERRDTIDFSSLNLNYFDDEKWSLKWNGPISRHLTLRLGSVYHRRAAVNKTQLALLDKPTTYRSFAPFITLLYHPSPKWPIFTINYEHSFKNIMKSNTEYERWEFDTSYKKSLKCLRLLSIRFGGGLYTNKSTNYFVDFENFHEDYVPGGWDDDWSGDFQLLNSQWYNASKYYVRANASYESPMLFLTHLPLFGRYIETERLYFNTLHIEHTRPYNEIGYGFTNRYFSVGIFGSFLNGCFHEIGCKYTFELFKKW